MNLNEFNECIAIIHDAHPKRTYSKDQLLRLYTEIKIIKFESFKKAVETILDTSQYFPTIHTLRQACRPLLDAMRGDLKVFSDCTKCSGTGQCDYQPISAQKKGRPLVRFAIACPFCDAAESRGLSPAYFARVRAQKYYETDALLIKSRELAESADERLGAKQHVSDLNEAFRSL